MRFIVLYLALQLGVVSLVRAQTPFPLKDLGEIEFRQPPDLNQRKTINLQIAKAVTERDQIRLEGLDKSGKPWRVWMDRGEMTYAWTADLDRNGQTDLIVENLYATNGRCTDSASLLILTMDANGRPVPWQTETKALNGIGSIVVEASRAGNEAALPD